MIVYKDSVNEISAGMLKGFFSGWRKHRSPSQHLDILTGSGEVLPAYKNRGIGSQLVRKMLEKLKNFYMVDVVCEEDVQPFYQSLAFVKANAMIIRRYQSDDRSGG